MPVYIVQHGLAMKKEEDSLKRLSKKGIEISEFMADLAKTKNIKVSEIIHSDKARAVETAKIFGRFLNPEKGLKQVDFLSPKDSPETILETIKKSSNLMIVGHLPFLDRLLSLMIINNTEPGLIKFQNAGIICVDKEEKNERWIIKWTLMPQVS